MEENGNFSRNFKHVKDSLDKINDEVFKLRETLPEIEASGDANSRRGGYGFDVGGAATSKRRSPSPLVDASSPKKTKHDFDLLEMENRDFREQNDQLKQQLLKSQADCREFSMRLSKEMEVKVASDESSLENICVKNRPMNIAEEYQTVMSDSWLDAKDALDNYFSDDPSKESKLQRLNLLHDILMAAESVLTSVLHEMLSFIRTPLNYLDQPMLCVTQKAKNKGDGEELQDQKGSVYLQFNNAVGDMLRARADKVDCGQFLAEVYAELAKKHPDVEEDIIEHVPKMDDYTKKACAIVWKMLLQRPQMRFDTPGIGEPWMGESHQDVSWESADPVDPSSRVTSYVYPVLYHGDKVMVKGKVVVTKVQIEDDHPRKDAETRTEGVGRGASKYRKITAQRRKIKK